MSTFRFACDSVPGCEGQIIAKSGDILLIEGTGSDHGCWFLKLAEDAQRFSSRQELDEFVAELAQDASEKSNWTDPELKDYAGRNKPRDKDKSDKGYKSGWSSKELEDYAGDAPPWKDAPVGSIVQANGYPAKVLEASNGNTTKVKFGDGTVKDIDTKLVINPNFGRDDNNMTSLHEEARRIEDKINKIVDNGGRVSLSDPLSIRLKQIRREISERK